MKILLVEDHKLLRESTVANLEERGHEVIPAEHAADANQEFYKNQPDLSLVITDVDLGRGMTGIEFAEKLVSQNDWEKERIIIVSGDPNHVTTATAKGFHALSKSDTAFISRLLTIADAMNRQSVPQPN